MTLTIGATCRCTYNIREYFHGKTAALLKSVKWIFLVLVFPLPVVLLAMGLTGDHTGLMLLAFVVQYDGLLQLKAAREQGQQAREIDVPSEIPA